MVGVCLTVLGLLRVFVNYRGIQTIADDIVVFSAFAFLFSCLFSYWGLHSHQRNRLQRIEKVADTCFLSGLVGMVVACCFITYSIIPQKHDYGSAEQVSSPHHETSQSSNSL